MKILFDINIILDVMLLRQPFLDSSLKLLIAVEKGNIEGYLCSSSITTIHYLIAKVKNSKIANDKVGDLLKLFNISSVNQSIFISALDSKFSAFEDAVIHESAFYNQLDGIVTRNINDFKKSKISIYTPKELYLLITG